MTVDILSKAGVNEQQDEQARRAVKAFRALQPTLTSYARVLTGRKNVRVDMAAQDNGSTDGSRIYFRPPIALGDMTPHERRLCDKRDEDGTMRCKACAIREAVLVTIYHEIAHICYDSFARTTDADKRRAIEFAVKETKNNPWAAGIEERIKRAPRYTTDSYMGLCGLINEYLPFLVNCLEDARVNRELFKARPGVKRMFQVDTTKVFNEGFENRDSDGALRTKRWNEAPLNSQVMIGVFCKASGYDYSNWFHADVIEALDDAELTRLVKQMDTIRSAGAVFNLAFKVLARLRELGFCGTPQDPDPEPEPEPEEENSEEEPQDSTPEDEDSDSSEEGDGDSSSDSPEPSSEDSESGEDEGEAGEPGDESEEGSDSEGASEDQTGESGEDEVDDEQEGSGDGTDPEGDSDESGSDGAEGSEGSEESDDGSDGLSGDDEPGSGDSEQGSDDTGESDGDSGLGDEGSEADQREEPVDDNSPADSDSGASEPSDSSAQSDSGDNAESDDNQEGSARDSDSSESGRSDGSEDVSGESSGPGGSDAPVLAPAGDSEGSPEDGEPAEGDDKADRRTDASSNDQQSDGDGSRPDGDTDSEAESEGVEAADTGADDGYGGTEVVEDDSAPEAPSRPHMGDPDDIDPILKKWGDHEEKPKSIAAQEEETAVDRAIIQGIYFTKPSKRVFGVREHRHDSLLYDDHGNLLSKGWRHSKYARRVGQAAELIVPESILQPAILRMRRAFTDNQIGSYEHNRKSGRVNRRVLGSRAWSGDERLFAKKRAPGKKDYFVILSMDISGSTLGRNIALEKRAVMALATMLDRVGIPFAVYAHTGDYHDGYDTSLGLDLEVYYIKEANEPWQNEKVQRRLEDLGPASANLDGHALEFMRKRADESTATEKIIMYFSDGKMPAENHDEELDILTSEIRTCASKGYTLLGVGIRTDSPSRHGLDTVEVHEDGDLVKVVNHLARRLR